jgi:hypothetical protein
MRSANRYRVFRVMIAAIGSRPNVVNVNESSVSTAWVWRR